MDSFYSIFFGVIANSIYGLILQLKQKLKSDNDAIMEKEQQPPIERLSRVEEAKIRSAKILNAVKERNDITRIRLATLVKAKL